MLSNKSCIFLLLFYFRMGFFSSKNKTHVWPIFVSLDLKTESQQATETNGGLASFKWVSEALYIWQLKEQTTVLTKDGFFFITTCLFWFFSKWQKSWLQSCSYWSRHGPVINSFALLTNTTQTRWSTKSLFNVFKYVITFQSVFNNCG